MAHNGLKIPTILFHGGYYEKNHISLTFHFLCSLFTRRLRKKIDETKIITTSPETVSYQPDLRIVTTVFPVYDWVRQILGDRLQDTELTLLLKNGVDLHSYQPTTDDLVAISNADIFIYVGGHSDTWVEDALGNEGNPNRIDRSVRRSGGFPEAPCGH